ncbi:hypothetical protein [Allokutzneria albata]|uniref:hypothetical protein n=1 Tax=Allokutzneria albata TaxID=211114 RepID=UPI0004C330DD|nr:hypothetical protein [Allokutzneria albata]
MVHGCPDWDHSYLRDPLAELAGRCRLIMPELPADQERRAAADPPGRHLGQPPTAKTRIANYFLAADYVRNDIDLATMEGANEAAREAVNALLDASGRCTGRRSSNCSRFMTA